MASYGKLRQELKQTPSIQLVINYWTNAQLLIIRWLERFHSQFILQISLFHDDITLTSVFYNQSPTPSFKLTAPNIGPQVEH